ncbi:hypothetical protein M3221_12050 [Domibacillus indicus]|uniref:hypothetical protein n=1 Tax=Domibacillus indicus TaxID=1437523 RepID=UPI00203DFA76|nr:hypothetical protein [Domibacillus indicus]MCM3789136.1 hypothetical protein [Domibacillus indicus]
MFELGVKIFKINAVQILFILICFGLAILAKSLSIDTTGLSLSEFISINIQNLFEEQQSYSAAMNIWLPIALYVISALLLLWMGITNIATLSLEEGKINTSLKVLLGAAEIGFVGWFLFEGGKLFLYAAAFAFLLLFIVALFTSSSRR